MLQIKKSGVRIAVKIANEFSLGPRSSAAQKIFSFSILNNAFFVVARSGLVQLYEKQKTALKTLAYKLTKEWKNSTASSKDRIVSVGSFRNQYMFTCSNEGKFVIRDLINDDADDSVKTYLLDGPISCAEVAVMDDNMRILIAAGGRDNELKLYDVDFGCSLSCNLNRLYSVEIPNHNINSMVRFANDLAEMRPLRRSLFQYFTTFSEWKRLVPVFVMSSTEDHSLLLMPIFHWILSVAFVEHFGKRMVCAGTQYGDLIIYEAEQPYTHETETAFFHLSQFPINVLHVFCSGRYLLYSDTMSKIGVLDMDSLKVVNFYDCLKIGPSMSCRIFTSLRPMARVSCNSEVSRFSPIYVLATTLDGNIVVYKLHNNNEKELKLIVQEAGIIPDLEILDVDSYTALDSVFASPEDLKCVLNKRRRKGKMQSGISEESPGFG